MPYGLRLPDTLGYPATPHNFFRPERRDPRALITGVVPGVIYPIDAKGITLEDARKIAADEGNDLELVQIDKDGAEVEAQPKITKDELVAYAATLDPPLELHAYQTKDEMHAALAEHEAAIAAAAGASQDENTDSQEGQD